MNTVVSVSLFCASNLTLLKSRFKQFLISMNLIRKYNFVRKELTFMNKQYSQNQKQYIINRYFSGAGVEVLSEETGISRSTIYNWVKVERQLREKKAAEKENVNYKSYSNSRNTRSDWREYWPS